MIAIVKEPTASVGAGLGVIDIAAVAHVEPVLGAKPPDRSLNVAREIGRKFGVERARIDGLAGRYDEGLTAARAIATRSVRVTSVRTI